jgi:hypothetical protein
MALEWIATFVPAVAGLIMDDELECVCKETAVACFIYYRIIVWRGWKVHD